MYAETRLLFPYYLNFSQDACQFEDLYEPQKPNALLTTISEYDLGGEGDLFKAPQPIIDEPVMDLDPMTVAISMMSCGEDPINSQVLKMVDIDSISGDQLLSEVFYECKKDILAKEAIETPLSEVLDIKIPTLMIDENHVTENKSKSDVTLQRSVSSGFSNSMEWMHGAPMTPSLLDFPVMDFKAIYGGLRRAYSEGDMKTLSSGNMSVIHSPHQPSLISSCSSEERKEKLSRYRNKKTKRNFGRKIKYACRKALADKQPRIHGRFAKTED